MVLALEVGEVIKVAMIPVIAGVIGYGTNWLAVRMMFEPIEFVGRPPIGWQGVIPAKAGKMASISVDKGLSKLGSLSEFYMQLDPDRIAEHIVESSRAQVREMVEQIAARDHPELWNALPQRLKEAIHERVQAELPGIVNDVTHDIGRHIEELMDLKLMVVRQMQQEPQLVNRMFSEVGEEEFDFIVKSGAYFGFGLGLVQMLIWIAFPAAWVLPVAGLLVGYATNWLALKIIFEPIEPRQVGGVTLHGLFLKRQSEVADVYSKLVTENVLTLSNIVHEMMNGPHSDRTLRLLESHLHPALDEALGIVRPAVRLAVGPDDYERMRVALSTEAVEITMGSFGDRAFNEDRGQVLHRLISERMRSLSPAEFAALLRSAFEEDEWQLIAVGAVLGFLAGLAQVVFVF